jgi:hypothetical protein
MGAICSNHKTFEPIVKNLTVDQLPARKAKDVIGHILGCGCKFGNKQFMKIQEVVNDVNAHFSELEEKLKDERSAQIAKALAPLSSKGGSE